MNIFLMTLGCPKNQVDSEMMAQLLADAGHATVADPQEADVLIVNTCGFIRDAREESLDTLSALAQSLRRDQSLIAAGCLAQRDSQAILRRVPAVDGILGTRSWPEIVDLVEQLATGESREVVVREEANLVASVRRTAVTGASAYLKIADGCDAQCAFCAIPAIKGPQVSKSREDILREACELLSEGVRELVLIAQDTTAYGRDLGLSDGLPDLLDELCAVVPEESWIRVLYAYPQHISDQLIATMAARPQICHYLDLPLQHGHPEVLRRMRRPHDLDTIHERVGALRAAMPDIALRSTFIVGFPGETAEEYGALLQMLQEIAFDHVGVFSYSRERGTPAATMPGQVPARVARERHEGAMLAQQAISLQRNREQIGRVLRVLVEEPIEEGTLGRSYRDAPEIDGTVILPEGLPVGEFLDVRITDAEPYDLYGEPALPLA